MPGGGGHAVDDRLQHLLDADARLAAGAQHVERIDAEGRLHLGDDDVGPGDRQVDLVEHRHDGQIALHRQIGVGDGLGLHALKRIDEQDDPFAGGQAARHFVVEIDVARRVDEVQLVLDAVGPRDRW